MLKKIYLKVPLLLMLLLASVGCNRDDDAFVDVDGAAPQITFASEFILNESGEDILIEATINDNDGLMSVSVIVPTFYINRTIDIVDIYSEPLTEYELSYKISTDIIGNIDPTFLYPVEVVATDIGGRSVSSTIYVTFDPPTMSSSMSEKTTFVNNDAQTTEFDYQLSFTANGGLSGLKSVAVSIDGVDGATDEVTALGGVGSYSYDKTFAIPAVDGIYTVNIEVVDTSDLVAKYELLVEVTDSPDFEKLYVMEGRDLSTLTSDVTGIPMMVKRSSERLYSTGYYSRSAGTEIYFLNTKEDASEFFYGVDPDDNTKILNSYDDADPFVLEKANTYYNIEIDTYTKSYSIEEYTPTTYCYTIGEAVQYMSTPSETHPYLPMVMGVGVGRVDSWKTNTLEQELSQDSDNPYIFYIDLDLTAATASVGYSIFGYHDSGWWNTPNWKWNSATEPEAMVFNIDGSKTNESFDVSNKFDVPATGKYRLELDQHLLRSKLYPISE